MTALDAALVVLVLHGLFGAFDTFYCHERQAALPHQPWAGPELAIHAIRSSLYALIFIGVAWFEWRGALAWALFALLAVEFLVTLRDSVIEDRTRRLSRVERVVHMILGATTGAYVALIVYHAWNEWLRAPSALTLTSHGVVSLILTGYAVAVLISAARDAVASKRLLAAA